MEAVFIMEEKKRHIVKVYSQDIPIKSAETEEYINSLADFVDKRMKTLSSGAKISFSVLSILCSISIADEFFKMKKNVKNHFEEENEVRQELSDALVKIMMLEGELHEKTSDFENYKEKALELEEKLKQNEKIINEMREKFNVLSYELKKKPEERDIDKVLEETGEILPKKIIKEEKKQYIQLDLESML